MIRGNEQVFVDTGAWVALAVSRDPLHLRARQTWDDLRKHGARLVTSVPVVMETFIRKNSFSEGCPSQICGAGSMASLPQAPTSSANAAAIRRRAIRKTPG